jgi:hypothetical protein
MSQFNPDLADPEVWELLSRNHVPMESMVRDQAKVTHHGIYCEFDSEPWPCQVKLLLEDSDQPSRLHYDRKR